jgi:hypothetical protein
MKNIGICKQFKLFGLLTYTVVWLGLFIIYEWSWGGLSFPYMWFYLAIASGYIFVLIFQSMSENQIQKSWLIVWFIIFGSVILQILGLLKLLGYGDQGQLAGMLVNGIVWPRWLGGSAILLYMYGLWTAVPALSMYANDLDAVTMFVKVTGHLVMLLISINALNRWRNRMSVILPLATPIYLMFSLGYDEYYPFIAGLFLVFLMTILEKEPAKQNVYWFGFLLALLPVFYFPFLIVSLIALVYYWVFYSSIRLKLLFTFLSVYVLSVFLFWSSDKGNYIASVVYTLNTGDRNTIFARYIGQSAGNGSVFFKLQNVVSWEHFNDLFYMLFWSGNMVVGILLGICIYYLLTKGAWKSFIASPRVPLLAMLFIWQLFYFVFMLPKLGPRTDIDLFFSFYIFLAFVTGHILDFIKSQLQLDYKIDSIVIPAVAANAVVTLFFLVVVGIPKII